MRATRLLLCLAGLLIAVPPAMAQPADQESPAPGEQQPAAEVTEAPPEIPADAEPQDPFEYEASEQISEDLSVSFPVDI